MYGYYTAYGYMGFVDGRWILFATEKEYDEYIERSDMDEIGNEENC